MANVANIGITCGGDSFVGHATDIAQGTASRTSRKPSNVMGRVRPYGFGGDEADASSPDPPESVCRPVRSAAAWVILMTGPADLGIGA
jgi:hypothetical protein